MPSKQSSPRTPKLELLLLALVLVVALALRLYGIDWDRGNLFHPDERAILMKLWSGISLPHSLGQFFSADSPLNPKWFSYGSLPIYLLKGVSTFVSWFHQGSAGAELRLVGRALSALFDTGTVLLVYMLGARLYGRRVGLVASALAALSVLSIQLSHFYTVDAPLTFFVVLTVFLAARLVERVSLARAVLVGLSLGLALATKISVLTLLFPIAGAYLLYCFQGSLVRRASFSGARSPIAALGFVVSLAAAAIVFALAEPYAFIDRFTFLADTARELGMARGSLDLPYTRQYMNTAPYWYHIQQLGFWGLGPLFGALAWAGLLFALFLAVKGRRKSDLLLLAWVVPYFLLVGGTQVKFMRYLLPLVPFLAIVGSRLLFWARDQVRRRWLLDITMAVVLLATGLYALAYVRIYSQPHPAMEVSRWIRANVPPGAYLVKEHWEEGLPDLYGYRVSELQLYDPDTPQKLDHMVEHLAQADYLVFYSNRLYGTIPRLPQRYPITSRYYQLLFSGELGFELVDFATSYPNLWGVSLVDDTFSRPGLPVPPPLASYRPSRFMIEVGYADESFTVYDHPKVMAFANVKRLSQAELRSLLSPSAQVSAAPEPLMMPPGLAAANQAGGTWSAIFHRGSLANRFPAVAWLVLIEALSLVGLPLALMLFRPLADRGYLLAKSLSLLLVAYLSWLAASLHVLPFSRGTILLAALVLAAASALAYWRRHGEINAFLKANVRLIIIGEALFLAAFLGFMAIRMWNPDLWLHHYRGGEKFIDLAYLTAVVKSTYFPPYDPWFSGGYMNYYYFGQVLMAVPIKLSSIVPTVAFNLALPLVFALTVVNAFSLAYNLCAARGGLRPRHYILAGLTAAAFVAVVGNLDGAVQLVQGAWKVLAQHQPFPAFDFWRSSRMMPPDPPGFEITEFPFFSFLWADLHAHLIALPFTLLFVGSALALVLSARRMPGSGGLRSYLAERLPWPQVGLLLALSLTLGALRATNSWDFPTYLIFGAGAAAIVQLAWRQRIDLDAVLWIVVKAGLLYLLSSLLFLPYIDSYKLFYSGVERSQESTALYQYIGIHGLFLFVVFTFVARALYGDLTRRRRLSTSPPAPSPLQGEGATGSGDTPESPAIGAPPLWTPRLADGPPHKRWQKGLVLLAVVTVAAVLIAVFALHRGTVAFLLVPLAVVATLALRAFLRRDAALGATLFLLWLMAVALGIGVGVDLFTVEGDIERMNTVFKFYFQAWVLMALSAACCLWWLLGSGFASARRLLALRRLWLGLLALLLVAVLVYPVMATPARARQRFSPLPPTLDGMAYMKYAVAQDEKGEIDLSWDYQALVWMQDHIVGSPVIVEGNAPQYRWGGRVSVYTGLPAVIGWEWEQKQQRWGYMSTVDRRLWDVRTIYSDPNPELVMSLLRKYGVKYVYLGKLERLYYPAQGLAKFEGMVGQGLEVAYRNQEVTIYEVR